MRFDDANVVGASQQQTLAGWHQARDEPELPPPAMPVNPRVTWHRPRRSRHVTLPVKIDRAILDFCAILRGQENSVNFRHPCPGRMPSGLPYPIILCEADVFASRVTFVLPEMRPRLVSC